MPHSLSLRPLRVDDADAMAPVLADPDLYEFTGGTPPGAEELRQRYEILTRGHSEDGAERWRNWVVVLEPEGRPVGYVQATVPADGGPTQVAWLIGTPWQGRGLAKEAARRLVAELRGMGVRRFVADVHPAHTASQRVAAAIGLAPTDELVDGEVRWAGTLDNDDDDAGPVSG